MPLRIVRNDIVKMDTEAIVNTANEKPMVGSGCDLAVYKAAGYDVLLRYRAEHFGVVPEGEAFITPGFSLRADYIIHAVSPKYEGGRNGEEQKLRSCYRNSLALAKEHHIKSISFPLISTGGFGYPKEEGLRIALDEIYDFLMDHDMEIYLVVFDPTAMSLGEKLYPDLKSYIDQNYVREKQKEEYDDTLMGSTILVGNAYDGWGISHEVAAETAHGESSREGKKRPAGNGLGGKQRSGLSDLGGRFEPRRRTDEMLSEQSQRENKARSEPNRPDEKDWLKECTPMGQPTKKGKLGKPFSIFKDVVAPAIVKPTPKKKKSTELELEEFCDIQLDADLCENLFLEDDLAELKEKLDERKAHLADSFSEYLMFLIKERGMTNVEVYKRAIVDKKLFAKIKNDTTYHPQKLTCLCLCIGAKLNLDETKDLLARAGYALSPADMRDVIFSYFIEHEIYDMIELDIQLEEYGIPCIIA